MAKEKTKTGVPNKHLHARISYLHQAATYLTVQSRKAEDRSRASGQTVSYGKGDRQEPREDGVKTAKSEETAVDLVKQQISENSTTKPAYGGIPCNLSSHLTQVARKSQIRLHPGIKHTICKRCNSVLVEGESCKKYIENLSKQGRKADADVLVVACGFCGAQRRFPVGNQRQQKKSHREAVRTDENKEKPSTVGQR